MNKSEKCGVVETKRNSIKKVSAQQGNKDFIPLSLASLAKKMGNNQGGGAPKSNDAMAIEI